MLFGVPVVEVIAVFARRGARDVRLQEHVLLRLRLARAASDGVVVPSVRGKRG
jgi:hypothetical protein